MKNVERHPSPTTAKFFVLLLFLSAIFSVFSSHAETQFTVSVSGQGQPIVMIPGLMSNGNVWQEIGARLSKNHQVHILSLAGFGGTPAIHQPSVENTQQAVFDYITSHRLDNVILMGHSYGGFLSLLLARDHDAVISKVISVDGLPYLAPIFTRDPNTQIAMMQGQAQYLKQQYQSMSVAQLVEQTRYGLPIQATKQSDQDKILDMAANSDPATVGDVIYTMLTTDLRQDMAKISTPILILGASGGFDSQEQHQHAQEIYQQQLEKAQHATLLMNTQSKHFIMYDDPTWLFEQVTSFIQGE